MGKQVEIIGRLAVAKPALAVEQIGRRASTLADQVLVREELGMVEDLRGGVVVFYGKAHGVSLFGGRVCRQVHMLLPQLLFLAFHYYFTGF